MKQDNVITVLLVIGLFFISIVFPPRSEEDAFWKALVFGLILLFVVRPLLRLFGCK